jgi:hypothetical protein
VFEVSPPGNGVFTEIPVLPALAIPAAEICALSSVEPAKWVPSADGPHVIAESAVKPEPCTVSVKGGPPCLVNAGEMLSITGVIGLRAVCLNTERNGGGDGSVRRFA